MIDVKAKLQAIRDGTQKERQFGPAVYAVVNLVTGKFYIGRSGGVDRRFMTHQRDLRAGKHHNRLLQEDWNLYGPEAFRFSTLVAFDEAAPTVELEKMLIREYMGDDCYNLPPAGEGGRPPIDPKFVRINVPLRLPQWLADWIDAQPQTAAELIEAALLKAHKLKPPKNV